MSTPYEYREVTTAQDSRRRFAIVTADNRLPIQCTPDKMDPTANRMDFRKRKQDLLREEGKLEDEKKREERKAHRAKNRGKLTRQQIEEGLERAARENKFRLPGHLVSPGLSTRERARINRQKDAVDFYVLKIEQCNTRVDRVYDATKKVQLDADREREPSSSDEDDEKQSRRRKKKRRKHRRRMDQSPGASDSDSDSGVSDDDDDFDADDKSGDNIARTFGPGMDQGMGRGTGQVGGAHGPGRATKNGKTGAPGGPSFNAGGHRASGSHRKAAHTQRALAHKQRRATKLDDEAQHDQEHRNGQLTIAEPVSSSKKWFRLGQDDANVESTLRLTGRIKETVNGKEHVIPGVLYTHNFRSRLYAAMPDFMCQALGLRARGDFEPNILNQWIAPFGPKEVPPSPEQDYERSGILDRHIRAAVRAWIQAVRVALEEGTKDAMENPNQQDGKRPKWAKNRDTVSLAPYVLGVRMVWRASTQGFQNNQLRPFLEVATCLPHVINKLRKVISDGIHVPLGPQFRLEPVRHVLPVPGIVQLVADYLGTLDTRTDNADPSEFDGKRRLRMEVYDAEIKFAEARFPSDMQLAGETWVTLPAGTFSLRTPEERRTIGQRPDPYEPSKLVPAWAEFDTSYLTMHVHSQRARSDRSKRAVPFNYAELVKESYGFSWDARHHPELAKPDPRIFPPPPPPREEAIRPMAPTQTTKLSVPECVPVRLPDGTLGTPWSSVLDTPLSSPLGTSNVVPKPPDTCAKTIFCGTTKDISQTTTPGPADKPPDKVHDKPPDKAQDKPPDKALGNDRGNPVDIKSADKVQDKLPDHKAADKVQDKPHDPKVGDQPKERDWGEIINYPVVSMDDEMFGTRGFPDATNPENPIIAESLVFDCAKRVGMPKEAKESDCVVVCTKPSAEMLLIPNATIMVVKDEATLLVYRAWCFMQVCPGMVLTYNGDRFDFPYGLDRSVLLEVPLAQYLGPFAEPLTIKESVRDTIGTGVVIQIDIHCPGINIIDLYRWIKRYEGQKFPSYTLNNIAKAFVGKKKADVHHTDIPKLYLGGPDRVQRLLYYNIIDSFLVLQIYYKRKYNLNIPIMGRISGVQAQQLLSMGPGAQSQICQLIECSELGLVKLFRERLVNKEKYKGATVISPRTGFYWFPVPVMDFKSLYPSIMIAFNLCITTFLTKDDIDRLKIPADQYWTFQSGPNGEPTYWAKASLRKGVIPSQSESYIASRQDAKDKMEAATDDVEKAVYDAVQAAVKVKGNSVYGLSKQLLEILAATVTFIGRMLIEVVKNMVETYMVPSNGYTPERGYPAPPEVIYGDTDSVFPLLQDASMGEAMACGEEIARLAKIIFKPYPPIELTFEKVYYPYCLSSKKRYAGVIWTLKDYQNFGGYTKPDKKGSEAVRSDSCKIQKELIQDVYDMLLLGRLDDSSAGVTILKEMFEDEQILRKHRMGTIRSARSVAEFATQTGNSVLSRRVSVSSSVPTSASTPSAVPTLSSSTPVPTPVPTFTPSPSLSTPTPTSFAPMTTSPTSMPPPRGKGVQTTLESLIDFDAKEFVHPSTYWSNPMHPEYTAPIPANACKNWLDLKKDEQKALKAQAPEIQKRVPVLTKHTAIKRVQIAMQLVCCYAKRLLEGKVDMYKLVLSKSLRKANYPGLVVQVAVADKMRARDPGSAPSTGDRVPFVILKKPEGSKVAECAEEPLHVLHSREPIDVDHYMEKQIMKPICGILIPVFKTLYPGHRPFQERMYGISDDEQSDPEVDEMDLAEKGEESALLAEHGPDADELYREMDHLNLREDADEDADVDAEEEGDRKVARSSVAAASVPRSISMFAEKKRSSDSRARVTRVPVRAVAPVTMTRSRVLNKHQLRPGETGVDIMRGTKWGNKYKIGPDGDRAEVVAKHRRDVLADAKLQHDIVSELRGKNLVCFCAPKACHGDVYLEIANRLTKSRVEPNDMSDVDEDVPDTNEEENVPDASEDVPDTNEEEEDVLDLHQGENSPGTRESGSAPDAKGSEPASSMEIEEAETDTSPDGTNAGRWTRIRAWLLRPRGLMLVRVPEGDQEAVVRFLAHLGLGQRAPQDIDNVANGWDQLASLYRRTQAALWTYARAAVVTGAVPANHPGLPVILADPRTVVVHWAGGLRPPYTPGVLPRLERRILHVHRCPVDEHGIPGEPIYDRVELQTPGGIVTPFLIDQALLYLAHRALSHRSKTRVESLRVDIVRSAEDRQCIPYTKFGAVMGHPMFLREELYFSCKGLVYNYTGTKIGERNQFLYNIEYVNNLTEADQVRSILGTNTKKSSSSKSKLPTQTHTLDFLLNKRSVSPATPHGLTPHGPAPVGYGTLGASPVGPSDAKEGKEKQEAKESKENQEIKETKGPPLPVVRVEELKRPAPRFVPSERILKQVRSKINKRRKDAIALARSLLQKRMDDLKIKRVVQKVEHNATGRLITSGRTALLSCVVCRVGLSSANTFNGTAVDITCRRCACDHDGAQENGNPQGSNRVHAHRSQASGTTGRARHPEGCDCKRERYQRMQEELLQRVTKQHTGIWKGCTDCAGSRADADKCSNTDCDMFYIRQTTGIDIEDLGRTATMASESRKVQSRARRRSLEPMDMEDDSDLENADYF